MAAVEQARQRIARGLLLQRGLERLHFVDLVRELLVDGGQHLQAQGRDVMFLARKA